MVTSPGFGQGATPASEMYAKAMHLYEKRKWAAAKEYFHRYLAEYSDSSLYITSLYSLAYCYQQLKDLKEALSIYHKVVEEARGDDAFWAQMAQKRIASLQ